MTREPTLQDVKKQFRAKLTPNIARLMKKSDPIKRQFLPSVDELNNTDLVPDPFEPGKAYGGIYGLERVYKDRIVITPHFDCSAYCRYCFKKTRTLAGSGKLMSQEDMDQALNLISLDKDLRVALITGGDPLRDEERLFYIIEGLSKIPHVKEIRIGTRNILFEPEKITSSFVSRLKLYAEIDFEDVTKSKSVAVAFSINHKDELTPDVIRATRKLIDCGIPVRGQVTLLKGVNDNIEALKDIYETFALIGISSYYLYHCMPVIGAMHFRTSLEKGQFLLRELSALSGVLTPHYVCVSAIGKIRIGPNRPLLYTHINDKKYLRFTTQYKTEDFLKYTQTRQLPLLHHTNEEGYIVSHYIDGNDH